MANLKKIATQIPDDVFECITKNAGIILSEFDTTEWSVSRSAIIGATSGGINFDDSPEYVDFGEDIDNCPKDTKELKEVASRTVIASGTFVSVRASEVARLAATADIEGNKITVRDEIDVEKDFRDLWILFDYGANGGAVCVHMMNTMNDNGLKIQSTDKAKGQYSFNLKAHYSLDTPDEVPYEIIIKTN